MSLLLVVNLPNLMTAVTVISVRVQGRGSYAINLIIDV